MTDRRPFTIELSYREMELLTSEILHAIERYRARTEVDRVYKAELKALGEKLRSHIIARTVSTAVKEQAGD